MINKRSQRLRRSQKTTLHIKKLGAETGIARLCLHRTPRHIYGQIIAAEGGKVLACASSLDKELRAKLNGKSKTEVATEVGKLLAVRAKQAGVEKVASDRGGFKYQGRLKAFVETVRENGVNV